MLSSKAASLRRAGIPLPRSNGEEAEAAAGLGGQLLLGQPPAAEGQDLSPQIPRGSSERAHLVSIAEPRLELARLLKGCEKRAAKELQKLQRGAPTKEPPLPCGETAELRRVWG